MKIYYIILAIVGIPLGIQAQESQSPFFHKPLTPAEWLGQEIHSIPILLERTSQQFENSLKTRSKTEAGEIHRSRIRILYKSLVKSEENFINYVIQEKPTLTDEEKRRFAILQKKKEAGEFKSDFLDKASVSEIIDKLKSEYEILKPKASEPVRATSPEPTRSQK